MQYLLVDENGKSLLLLKPIRDQLAGSIKIHFNQDVQTIDFVKVLQKMAEEENTRSGETYKNQVYEGNMFTTEITEKYFSQILENMVVSSEKTLTIKNSVRDIFSKTYAKFVEEKTEVYCSNAEMVEFKFEYQNLKAVFYTLRKDGRILFCTSAPYCSICTEIGDILTITCQSMYSEKTDKVTLITSNKQTIFKHFFDFLITKQ